MHLKGLIVLTVFTVFFIACKEDDSAENYKKEIAEKEQEEKEEIKKSLSHNG